MLCVPNDILRHTVDVLSDIVDAECHFMFSVSVDVLSPVLFSVQEPLWL